ncbi:MAG: DUF2490 domain-containing protein [Saprospiraceae bacterium]|nr:DUF2490 domain-containing protein [Saprospiraceae bacterium]
MNLYLKIRFPVFFVTLVLNSVYLTAQNRLSDYNAIGWYSFFGTTNIHSKWDLHTEFQWRRENVISDNLQQLVRVGVNYKLNPKIVLRLGYANIETYAYGDFPLNVFGKDFTEHRSFQGLIYNDKISKSEVTHRLILEQRWIGRYSNDTISEEDEFPYSNRLRYLFRCQIPLKSSESHTNGPYFAFFDEILIGFGKNVNANVFDQNRIGLLFGYKINKSLKFEAGFINQILQFGRTINGQNVFQYNSGLLLNAYMNLDVRKA